MNGDSNDKLNETYFTIHISKIIVSTVSSRPPYLPDLEVINVSTLTLPLHNMSYIGSPSVPQTSVSESSG